MAGSSSAVPTSGMSAAGDSPAATGGDSACVVRTRKYTMTAATRTAAEIFTFVLIAFPPMGKVCSVSGS